VPLSRLRGASEPERRALLLGHIVDTVRSVLGSRSSVPPTPQQKLFELGLKSLDLIELKDRLENDLKVELPVTLFFAYATLGGLTDHLLPEVLRLAAQEDPRRDAPEAGPAERPAAESERLVRLAEISEEEAERRLLERISDLERRIE
jgi:acyl carrier protein